MIEYPQRQRCKKCRKSLGTKASDPVYFGLYCSPECAQIPIPNTNPETSPRECVSTHEDGKWHFKRRYTHVGQIPKWLKNDPSCNWYRCGHCGHLHIGHTRLKPDEKFRMFTSLDDVSDLIRKARGEMSIKFLAVKCNVRPIRIKEIERGQWDKVDLRTVFKVCQVLKLRLGVSFSTS